MILNSCYLIAVVITSRLVMLTFSKISSSHIKQEIHLSTRLQQRILDSTQNSLLSNSKTIKQTSSQMSTGSGKFKSKIKKKFAAEKYGLNKLSDKQLPRRLAKRLTNKKTSIMLQKLFSNTSSPQIISDISNKKSETTKMNTNSDIAAKYFEILTSNQPKKFCGETLYYVVEYYCVYIKGTSVYSPDSDIENISVLNDDSKSKRDSNLVTQDEVNSESGGIVEECCHKACKPSQLEKYCS